MSASISATGYALSDLLLANSQRVSHRIATLTEQSSTGLIAQDYAGLGQGAATALDLQPQIARDQAIQTGITAAAGPMGVAQTALSQIGTLTTGIIAQLNNLNGLDASSVGSVAAEAQSALTQVAGLLDEQYGGSYVFAGQDSANPPVPNPGGILASGFYTQISGAVGALPTAGAATTAAATLAIAGSTSAGTTPFSATLESLAATGDGRTTVETGPGQRVAGVMLANRNGDAASSGTSTTGSYMRDILRGLATVASLTPASLSAGGFQALIQDTRTSLNGAVSAMSTDAGILGDRQTQLGKTATAIGDAATALGNQVADVTQANLAQTATALSLANTQLQASYQLIAGLPKLSLVQYV